MKTKEQIIEILEKHSQTWWVQNGDVDNGKMIPYDEFNAIASELSDSEPEVRMAEDIEKQISDLKGEILDIQNDTFITEETRNREVQDRRLKIKSLDDTKRKVTSRFQQPITDEEINEITRKKASEYLMTVHEMQAFQRGMYEYREQLRNRVKAQPSDEDIEKWADDVNERNFSYSYYDGLIDGAKSMRDGKIPSKK